MQNFKAKYIFQGLIFASLFLIVSVYVGKLIPWNSGLLEWFYAFVVGVGFFAICLHTLWDVDVRSQAEYEELLSKRFLPVRIPGKVTFLVIFVILCHRLWLGGGDMKQIYNENIEYTTSYAQNDQKIVSLWDYAYSTFTVKYGITKMNRDDFFKITEVIFDRRKDGANLTWKWLQENQIVPYGEFTKFYTDLSAFVDSKRGEVYSIEQVKQQIVKEQHVLLESFPNNWYNKILNLPHLQYQPVMLENVTLD